MGESGNILQGLGDLNDKTQIISLYKHTSHKMHTIKAKKATFWCCWLIKKILSPSI